MTIFFNVILLISTLILILKAKICIVKSLLAIGVGVLLVFLLSTHTRLLLEYAVLFSIYAYASGEDILEHTVPPLSYLLILLLTLINAESLLLSFAWGGGTLLAFTLLILLNLNVFPGGDVKFIICNMAYFASLTGVFGIALACVVVLLHYILMKKIVKKEFPKVIPFIPYLSIGYFGCVLLSTI